PLILHAASIIRYFSPHRLPPTSPLFPYTTLFRSDEAAARQRTFDRLAVRRRRIVLQIDGHLGGIAPCGAQSLQVRRDQEEAAEHEQRERDRHRRQQARLASAPQAGDCFVE